MSLRVRYQYAAGHDLGYSVERLADATFLDFADGTFKPAASALTPIGPLTPGTGDYLGTYADTIAETPTAQWADGGFAVYLHDLAAGNLVVGLGQAVLVDGDDAPFGQLAASGLDRIAVADPGGIANHNTLPRLIVALWRRSFKRVAKTSTQIKTYADDGSTVNTTQAIADDGAGNQTLGAAG